MPEPYRTVVLDGCVQLRQPVVIATKTAKTIATSLPFVEGPPGPTGPQGQRGEQGIRGERGPQGVTTGFGQITYSERVIEASDLYAPGQRGQILFEPDPGLTQDFLNAPFVGHAFWVDNRIVARAGGDLYDIQANLIVTTQVAGGQVRVDADVGSILGPVTSDTQILFNSAGEPERTTFRMRVQVLTNFLANGCRLFLTSSVPLTVISETVLIAPDSIRPGSGP